MSNRLYPKKEQSHLLTCEHPDIGIDVGLKSFLTDSEGKTVENPRFYRTSQKTLRRKQRMLCRRKKGSQRRRKAARSTAHTHLKIKRQRRDFHYKTAKQYAERYQVIAVEKLSILNMVQTRKERTSMQEAEKQFKVTKQDDGSVLLEHAGADSFTLTSDEAYALLDFLYKMRDDLASTVHQEDRQHIVHEFERTDQPAEQPAVANEYPVVPPGDSSEQAVAESQQTTREETLRAAEE